MGWDRREFIREGLSVPNPSSKGSFLAARWFLSCSEHWSADGATVLLKAGCRTSRLSSQGGCPMGTKSSSSGLSTQHSEQVEWWKHMGLSSWILWFREGRKALGPDSPLPPFCSRLSVFIRTISGSQHSWGCGTGHLPAPKGTGMRKPQEKEEFQATDCTDRKLRSVWSRMWDSTFLRKRGLSLELRRQLPEPELLGFSTFTQWVESKCSWFSLWGYFLKRRAGCSPEDRPTPLEINLEGPNPPRAAARQQPVGKERKEVKGIGWKTVRLCITADVMQEDGELCLVFCVPREILTPLRIPALSVRHYGPTPSSLGAQAG